MAAQVNSMRIPKQTCRTQSLWPDINLTPDDASFSKIEKRSARNSLFQLLKINWVIDYIVT